MLTKQEKLLYIRQLMLPEVGEAGQIKLKHAKVAVIGAGGLGCPVLLYLASSGVGSIAIIDFDVIDKTNLHRQVLYGVNDIGKKKSITASEKLKNLHPEININVFDVKITNENAQEILSNYDLIIDGCDNFNTRYCVNDTCVKLNKPLVYGSILGFQGQIAVFNFNGSKNLRDLFPEPPNPEDVPDCSTNGVLGTVPAIIGSIMVNEAIKLLIGMDVTTNSLLLFDMKKNQLNKVLF